MKPSTYRAILDHFILIFGRNLKLLHIQSLSSLKKKWNLREFRVFDREHKMRKRSYNLVCCCLGHLTLLSKEVNLRFETILDERSFLSKKLM